jgi:hypothetical protein
MVDMIARKRVKYPHGPTGREYAPGDKFAALSDRDAKGLYVSGRAVYAEKAVPKSPAELPAAAMAPAETLPNQNGESRRRYERRDMTAADGPTGGETPASSSPRGRRRKASTSTPSGDESAS